jgi:hypothetical protein
MSILNLKDIKITRLKQQLATYKLKEIAQQSIGPYSVKAIKKLSSEMSGFNSALELIDQNRKTVSEWFGDLPVDFQSSLTDLIIENVLDIEVTTDNCRIWLDISRMYGSSDPVYDLEVGEIIRMAQIHAQYGYDGVYAYVCHARGAKPTVKAFDQQYPRFDEALVEIGR